MNRPLSAAEAELCKTSIAAESASRTMCGRLFNRSMQAIVGVGAFATAADLGRSFAHGGDVGLGNLSRASLNWFGAECGARVLSIPLPNLAPSRDKKDL